MGNDTDPDGDPLALTSFTQPRSLGVVRQFGNVLLFTPHPLSDYDVNYYGVNYIQYEITDSKGATARAQVQITLGQAPVPLVELRAPEDEAWFQQDSGGQPLVIPITVFAQSQRGGGSISRVDIYDQTNLIGRATGPANDLFVFDWQTPAAGDHLISAIASDVDVQNISQPALIHVQGKAGNTPPRARITNLPITEIVTNGMRAQSYPVLREGVFSLMGDARDEKDPTDLCRFQIRLLKPDGTVVADLTPEPLTNGYHIGTNNAWGVIASNLDLSIVPNGTYDLELNVFDTWEISSDTARFILDTQLKVGQFSFSVQDLAIPVAGMPLTVVRTYNSFNLNQGDFGYSWTYAINELDFEMDELREETADLFYDDSDTGFFSRRVGGGRDITLTLPDGRRTTFYFTMDGPYSCDSSEAKYCYFPRWQAPPGVTYSLIPSSELIYNALTRSWNADGLSTFDNYDMPGFVLTNQDGTQYVITRDDLGEHFYLSGNVNDYYAHAYGKGRLTDIIQRDRNRIHITPTQIDHFDASNHVTRSVFFKRDGLGRITELRDPNSGSEGRAVMKYFYHPLSGNLIEVKKLVDRNAGEAGYESTFYDYTNAVFPHYLTAIRDPHHVQLARTEYDEDGRISAVVDADGNRTEFRHYLDRNIEIVTNRLGHTSSYVYDLRGNVIWQTNALSIISRTAYDEQNHEIAVTNAVGTSVQTWTTNGYDENGYLSITVDALHTNWFLHDQYGNLLSQTDSLGNIVSNRYDEFGNLTNTLHFDPHQTTPVAESSSRYEGGKLVETRDANHRITASYAYDSLGNLASATDANNLTRTFGYDANGNQTSSSYDWGGQPITTTTEYDAAGRVVRTVDSENNETRTVYNSLGKTDYTVDKLGNTNRFLYDTRGNLIQTTYPDGLCTRTVYNEDAKPILTSDRNQITGTRTEYDALGRVTNSIRLTNVVINIVGTGSQVQSEVGSATAPISTNRTDYDELGRVTSRTGPDGQTTTYTYYPDGQLKSVTDPLTNTTYYAYDAAGHQAAITNASQMVTRFGYDALGRQNQIIFHDATWTSNVFNNVGQRTGQIDQAGLLTQYGYDISGQLTNVVMSAVPDPANPSQMTNATWTYQYDTYGRLAVIWDALGRPTINTYDALGRQLEQRLPLSQTSSNLYNAKGQLWKQYDFKGQHTEIVYDRLGRVRAKFRFGKDEADPREAVCYQYNQLGQLWRVVQRYDADASTNACDGYAVLVPRPPGAPVSSRLLGCLARIPSNTTGGLTALALLALGMVFFPRQMRREFLMVLRDALAENFACFAYSAVSGSRRLRLPSVWWRLATLTTIIALLGSDPKLDFWSARAQGTFPRNDSTDTTRITELAYNLDGHLAQVNCPEGVINYGYDLATGRHSSTCTTNSEVAYGYDALGRLKTVSLLKRNGTSLVNPEVTTYTYTAVGNRETITLPNGTVTRYQYDSLSRLTNLTHTATNGTLLASYSYQLHATGRRTGALEVLRDAGTNTYTTNLLVWAYDGMYRLTNEVSSSTATFGTYTNAYLYDQVGNRLKKIRMASSGTNTVDYGYNDNDQLLDEVSRLNDSITTNSYAYDDNGSLTGKATNGVTVATYAYNLANKMKSVTANLITTAFHYNDQGIRVRSIASDVKHYLLDANNHTGYAQVLEEFNAAGSAPTLAMSYVLGDDVVGQCGTGTSDPRWLLYDGHGSTRQLVRNSSDVASQFHYDGYGTSLTPLPGSADTRLLYCGEEYDTTLEMYNLRARYYDQNSARFNQRDTYLGTSSDPLSLHK